MWAVTSGPPCISKVIIMICSGPIHIASPPLAIDPTGTSPSPSTNSVNYHCFREPYRSVRSLHKLTMIVLGLGILRSSRAVVEACDAAKLLHYPLSRSGHCYNKCSVYVRAASLELTVSTQINIYLVNLTLTCFRKTTERVFTVNLFYGKIFKTVKDSSARS